MEICWREKTVMTRKDGGGGGEKVELAMTMTMTMTGEEEVRDLPIVREQDRDMLRRAVDIPRVEVEVGVQP